jgi:hypothetical protein
VVLDYIENCGLTRDIQKYVPEDRQVIIDLSSFDNLQGLGYNELDYETDNLLELYNNAKLKTNQLGYLVNSINIGQRIKGTYGKVFGCCGLGCIHMRRTN